MSFAALCFMIHPDKKFWKFECNTYNPMMTYQYREPPLFHLDSLIF